MFDSAAQSEGHRGGAVAVSRRGDASAHGRAGRSAGEAVELPLRRHGRIHRRRRAQFLFSRDEHPPAGRASGNRTDHRRRSGRRDDQESRPARPLACQPGRCSKSTAGRWRAGSTPKTPTAISCRRSAGSKRYRPPAEGVDADGRVIRNDTGVEEGGEISMFYDPMIAKLCTWGPDRAARRSTRCRMRSIVSRSTASATTCRSCRPSWIIRAGARARSAPPSSKRNIPTVSQGVEPVFGDGVHDRGHRGVLMHHISQARDIQISGVLANHQRPLHRTWVVKIGTKEFAVRLDQGDDGFAASIDGGPIQHLQIVDWVPGQTLSRSRRSTRSTIDPPSSRSPRAAEGWRLRHRGADHGRRSCARRERPNSRVT